MTQKLFSTKKSAQSGFTLIELLIYVVITSMLFGTVITVLLTFTHARAKQQAIIEVESQGDAAMTLLTQTVRNANAVTTPSSSATTTTLSVTTYLASTTPTVFDLAGGALRITEGTNAAISLTNDQIIVSNLAFLNLARPNTNGSVKIQFTVTYATTTNRFDQNYSATFYGTATVHHILQ
ncbi:MAG: prepilin-type N-terminal cleavage/methylation domain-containing protein [bacterium]